VDLEIAELHGCAERALLLTRELLMAARPRSGVRRPVNLNHVVAAVTNTLSRVMGGRIRLQVDLSTEPVPVVAEFIELERIIVNLALNSRDAMAGDGVLTFETAIIGDSSSRVSQDVGSGSYVYLRVTDTGCGLTPDVTARMFEPFFTTKETGTGLGLSSVASTVRELGGTICVDGQPGRGTSVRVILPMARENHL
jgi:signal transduction histidine kinase